MSIPASISAVLAIIGLFLIFNGGAQMRTDVDEMKINDTKVEVYNKAAEGTNPRKLFGVFCIIGATLSGFAALGMTTIRKGGIEEDGQPLPPEKEDY
ncbi:MAG: hypothetical protein AB8F95_21295 [Bacteroidia bacterium]